MTARGDLARRARLQWGAGRLVLALAATWAAASSCGGDDSEGTDADKDAAVADVGAVDGGGSDAGVDVVADTAGPPADVAADSTPPKDVTLPDSGPDPRRAGAFEQVLVPGDPNTALHACATEGSARAYLAGTNGTILGWNGAQWALLSDGSFQTLHGVAAAGPLVHAVGIDGTLLQGNQAKGLAAKWGPPGGCAQASECEDDDTCTADFCDSGVCRHEPSGKTGCCGAKALQDGFANLAGWTVTDLYEKVADKGGVVFSAAAMTGTDGKLRATSPPKALYFGRTDAPCPGDASKVCPSFDNGKVVGSTLLSQPFSLPPGAKIAKATLTFQVRLDVENGLGFDALAIRAVEGSKKTDVWTKAALGGSGSTEGAFVTQVVDLTNFAGKTIQLEVSFDSVDASMNATEGVFVDDMLVTSTCKAGSIAAKGMTTATFFDVWAADVANAWAVGSDGVIAHWDGTTWKLQTGGAVRDTLAIAGIPGGQAVASGSKGKAGSLTAGAMAVPEPTTPLDLVDIDLDATAAPGKPVAIAITKAMQVFEFDGAAWKQATVGIAGGAGVAALGDGTWAAVGSNAIWERSTAGVWSQKSIVGGAIYDIASLGGGQAVAVGAGGLLVERKGGVWQENFGPLGFANYLAVHVGDGDGGAGWAVGEGGIAAQLTNGNWTGVKTNVSKHLNDVWTWDANTAWAVGLADTILRWNGSKFEAMQAPIAKVDWLAVGGTDPSDVYFAGKGGIVMRWNGAKFEIVESPVTGTLRDVWGFGAKDVWAVGSKGGIFHSTGGSWTRVPIEPYEVPEQEPYKVESDLYAIWGAAPDDIWAAGAPDSNGQGVLVHYDGKLWKYVPAFTKETRTVRALWGWSGKDMLLAGTAGMLYHFDGASFSALSSGSIATLFAVCGWGKDALVVGSGGTVLRYLPPPPKPADNDANGADAGP